MHIDLVSNSEYYYKEQINISKQRSITMNFDFLKDLRGLGYVYENCCNAEKLAVAMPVQSVFTSRKSAELLAKFLYMAAHNQEMENLHLQISFQI